MTDSEVGQAAHWQRGGSTIKRHVRFLPNFAISCNVQPISRGILRFNVQLVSDFDWHGKWAGGAQGFWLWVEDSEVRLESILPPPAYRQKPHLTFIPLTSLVALILAPPHPPERAHLPPRVHPNFEAQSPRDSQPRFDDSGV